MTARVKTLFGVIVAIGGAEVAAPTRARPRIVAVHPPRAVLAKSALNSGARHHLIIANRVTGGLRPPLDGTFLSDAATRPLPLVVPDRPGAAAATVNALQRPATETRDMLLTMDRLSESAALHLTETRAPSALPITATFAPVAAAAAATGDPRLLARSVSNGPYPTPCTRHP